MVRFACPAGIEDTLRDITANEDDASYHDILYDPEGNHTEFAQYATLYYDHNGESTRDGDERGSVECTYCGRIAYDFENMNEEFDSIEGRMIQMGYTTRRNCGFNEVVYATPEDHAENCENCTDILEVEEDPFEPAPTIRPRFTQTALMPATIHGEWRESRESLRDPLEGHIFGATFDTPRPTVPMFRIRAGDGA